LQLSFDFAKLSDEERKQFTVIDNLLAYALGQTINDHELYEGILSAVDDWKKKMGGRNNLEPHIRPYLEKVIKQDRDAASNLYYLISPIFSYIHVLFELSRSEWRNATSWSGMFCERIVKNLLRAFDLTYSTHNYQDVENITQERKVGRLKSILQSKQFALSDELCSLLDVIYALRNTRGPHDVPPPEPIRAQISASQCLPVYIDYLECLIFLKKDIIKDYNTFVDFFSNLTETKITLTFGQEGIKSNVDQLLRNVLYREGYFGRNNGRRLNEIQMKLKEMGYNFSDQATAKALLKLSKGKDAVITRKGKRKNYLYVEKYPPSEVFKTSIIKP
jgi:hypothetical protein